MPAAPLLGAAAALRTTPPHSPRAPPRRTDRPPTARGPLPGAGALVYVGSTVTSARRPALPDAPPAGSLRLQLARADIARAAVGVFARLGAEATRVEDLLRAADVARRTFYKHFRSKDDVLTAVYEMVTRELLAAIASHRGDGADPMASIRATLDVYLGFHVDNREILRVLLEQSMRSESALGPMRRRFRAELVQALELAFLTMSGRALDPFVFLALVSGLEGLSQELLSGPTDRDAVDRVRRVMHGLLDAVLHHADALPKRA